MIYLSTEHQTHLTSWQLAVLLPKLGLEDALQGEIPVRFLHVVEQKLDIYLNQPYPLVDAQVLNEVLRLTRKAAQCSLPLHWSR
jgi:hypothetical protein